MLQLDYIADRMSQPLVLQMKGTYPFGQLSSKITQETLAVVKKTLHFETEEQYGMIENMLHFLHVARHPNLVNIQQIAKEQRSVEIYYEYAPLRLEKWLLDVNQEIIAKIEMELIEMAQHLTRASIKFQFDPLSLGLSQELSAKYFLNEFSVDLESQEDNFLRVKADINEYFKKISLLWKEQAIEQERKPSVSESLSTSASISSLEEFPIPAQANIETPRKTSKYSLISEKVESSKKKSLQVLSKFKKLAQK